MKTSFSPFCSSLHFWQGTASIFYSSDITPIHYHNTLQLIFDLNGSFLFRTEHDDWKRYRSLIIRENVAHQLNTNGSIQLIIYLETNTMLAKNISETWLASCEFCEPEVTFSPLEEELFQKNLMSPKPGSLELLIELALKKVQDIAQSISGDQRIVSVLQTLKRMDPAGVTIDQLADQACISPSRLRAIFKIKVGMPLHQYIIKQRLLSATTAIVNGATVQNAAYHAGFTDASHFNKMMLKHFGINPSDFVRVNQEFAITGDHSFSLQTQSPVKLSV